MKSLDDNQADIKSLVKTIINRINERRDYEGKEGRESRSDIDISNEELSIVVDEYCMEHPNDTIIWGDD